MRIFENILLQVKSGSSISLKRSHSIPYICNVFAQSVYNKNFAHNDVLTRCYSNRRKSFETSCTLPHPQIHRRVLSKESLLYNNETLFVKRILNNPFLINAHNIRHYSSSPPVVINEAITYNGGLFQVISESLPVAWATEILRLIHYEVGLPWWATIILTTITMRAIVHVPLAIFDHQTRAKRENLQGELQEVAKTLKMELQMAVQASQLSSSQAVFLAKRAFAKEKKEMYERENCHPFISIAIYLLQAPIWISFSVAVRNMCYMLPTKNPATLQDYLQLTTGGVGWIQNLVQMDPFFVLPITVGLSGLAILEINDVLFNVPETKLRKISKNIFRVIIVALVPIMACLPSGLSLYWATNNCCGVLQNLVFLSPKVRRFGRIPKTSSELQHPYTELIKRLSGKFHLKRSMA